MEANSNDRCATIYLVDINTITDAQLTPLLSCLSPSESVRYQRLVRVERKRQFHVGRLLLRYALVRLMKIAAQDITLTEQERQAPLLHIAGVDTQPKFSISHSANWVACACSASIPIGLDIEQFDAGRNLEAISQHTFRPADVAWLQDQPDRIAAFYSLWSKKEARFKLTQGYEIPAIEHCYAIPHPTMSIVLMSEQALVTSPDCDWTEWGNLRRILTGNL